MGQGQVLIFLGAPMIFIKIKKLLIAVNASLRRFNNVTGVYFIQIPLLLIGLGQNLGHFSRYRPLLLVGWRIVQILRQTPEENDQYSANHS
jgi:hypothetical protein